jgi:hypothetical protein
MAFQAGFYCLPRRLAQWHPCCVDFAAEVDHGFETFARHPVGPREHSFDLVQLGSVPRQFQHSPTALNWSVLAVRQGVVEQLAGLAEGSDQLHQARQQLGPHAAALRAGVHFEVPPVNRAVFLAPQALPPRRERIDEEGSSPSVPVNPIRQQTWHFCALVHIRMLHSYSLPVRRA